MKKLLTIALSLALVFSLTACGGNGGNGVTESGNKATKLSSATDKWPSGIYDPLGIPEYKSGKLLYAYPNDEGGNVFFTTTREEFKAYIDSLIEKGFHTEDYNYEGISTKKWESFKMYLPNPGGKYALLCCYSWDNDGKGIEEELYEEDSGEAFTINYNVSFSLYEASMPSGWNKTDLLASVGLPDSKIKIENADKIVKEIVEEKLLVGAAIANNLKCATLGIKFAFDYNLTKEFLLEYENRLVEACKEITDDGKLYSWSGELDMEKVKTDGCGYWTYTYQGTKYSLQIFAETGYEEGITIVVQEVK